MLRELHHRIKNNLQLIESMLQLEANKQGASASKASVDTSVQRIHAMALVYETIYNTERLDDIDLVNYVGKLLDAVRDISSIEFSLDAEGSIYVGLDFAVPFGILLNELVSNAERHAFPEGSKGRVDIRIESGDGILLRVADDGIGIVEGFRIEETKTLGLSLVQALADQLRGNISLDAGSGTSWTVRFPA